MVTSLTDRLAARWLGLHGLAILAATVHAIVDWHIGLFGATATTVSPAQAGIAVGMSVLTALWAVGLAWAAAGQARGHATVAVVALLWGFAGNGLAVVGCLPPCPSGFPYQDLAHAGSLVFGGAAAWGSWRQLTQSSDATDWLVPGLAAACTVVVLALEALLAPGP